MAEHTHQGLEARAAEAVARAGLITSIVGATIMLAVLVGNLLVISLRRVPPSWLAVVVQVGPPLVALLGFIGTGSTWYGRWRILRRRAEYDVRDDLLDQALNAPGDAQGLPGQLGCAAALNPLVLMLGLLLCLTTFGPAPLDILGVGRNGANLPAATPTPQVAIATPVPSPTAVPPTRTPVPTATSIPPTPVVAFVVKPTSSRTSCVTTTTATDVPLTLDNTGSTTAVGWGITGLDGWAKPSAATGTIPAGKKATLTLTITNCPNIPINGFVDEQGTITLTTGGKGTFVFAVRIFGYQLR